MSSDINEIYEELSIRTAGISSELSLTLDRIVDVEHFISERTHEPNVLRFWVKMWCPKCDDPRTPS
jgi:thiol-disulfide isomerase/thioredoxin